MEKDYRANKEIP